MSKIQNRSIKPEFFVAKYMEIYVRGGTIRDLAKALGFHSTGQVQGRASYLRKKGVKLPLFQPMAAPVPRVSAVNPAALNSMIEGWRK